MVFLHDLQANTITSLMGLIRNTVRRYLNLIRKRIAKFCEQKTHVQDYSSNKGNAIKC